MKQAYLVHGWDGSPTNCWFPWLTKELEKEGYKVKALKMPHPEIPIIKDWVATLEKEVKLNEETILIGHSIGCQTIMRYLEKPNRKIKAAFLVAGFFNLSAIDEESGESFEVAQPWLETPIDFVKIKQNCNNFICFFSDDDEYVSIDEAKIFKKNLNAKIFIQKNKSHFELILTFPELLSEIKKAI